MIIKALSGLALLLLRPLERSEQKGKPNFCPRRESRFIPVVKPHNSADLVNRI